MYCQFCGAEATQELKYCKRCGGNLNPPTSIALPETTQPKLSPFSVAAIGLTTAALVVFGLLVVFGMIYNISSGPQGVRGDTLIWLGGFGAVTILGSVIFLVRLWMLLLGARQTGSAGLFPLANKIPTRELGTPVINALPNGMPPSVTEQTTRTFEPAYREPHAK